MVDGLLMVALLSFLVYGLISMQKNKNVFRKLNLKGNEIEIFEESDDSYFDNTSMKFCIYLRMWMQM